MPKDKRDKTTGLPLPSPVVPETSICFKIMVPNAIEYRSALKGALSSLGQAWTWTQTVGEDNQGSYDAAELWRARISDASYALDCEVCEVDCNDVANCIETSPAVQAAVATIVNTVSLPGTTSTQGVPMSPAQYAEQLNTRPTCDMDELWSQCLKFIEYLTQLGTDVFERLEAYSNGLEAATFIEMVPVIGTMIDEAGIDNFLDYLDWSLEVIQEEYASALDVDVINDIACSLFCAVQDDCVISVERTMNVINARLGGILVPSELETIDEVMGALVTIGSSFTLPVDMWLAFILGSAKTASYLGIRGIDKTVQIMLALAADAPSNSWTTLCPVCVDPEACPGGEFIDFTTSNASFTPYIDRALYEGSGVNRGWKSNVPVSPSRVSIWRTILPAPTKMKFNTNLDASEIRVYTQTGGAIGSILGATTTFVTEVDGTRTYEMPAMGVNAGNILIDIGSTIALPEDFALRSICWNYD